MAEVSTPRQQHVQDASGTGYRWTGCLRHNRRTGRRSCLGQYQRRPGLGTVAILALVVGGVLWTVLAIALLIASLLLQDFVVPIMYKRDLTVMAAVHIFTNELLKPNAGTFMLFYLMRLGLAIAMGFIAVLVTCATCCIAALPYLGTVILLPLPVFVRCYSLYMFEQFGREWMLLADQLCPVCSYDLRGSIGRPECPECGQPIGDPPVPESPPSVQ